MRRPDVHVPDRHYWWCLSCGAPWPCPVVFANPDWVSIAPIREAQ